jgi:hypothetical protein
MKRLPRSGSSSQRIQASAGPPYRSRRRALPRSIYVKRRPASLARRLSREYAARCKATPAKKPIAAATTWRPFLSPGWRRSRPLTKSFAPSGPAAQSRSCVRVRERPRVGLLWPLLYGQGKRHGGSPAKLAAITQVSPPRWFRRFGLRTPHWRDGTVSSALTPGTAFQLLRITERSHAETCRPYRSADGDHRLTVFDSDCKRS